MSAPAVGLFRDVGAQRLLSLRVLEPLVAAWDKDAPIRVWSAACGSGEDACCIAILLQELIDRYGGRIGFQLFATATSPDYERASRAVFSSNEVVSLPPERRDQWFDRTPEDWRLKHGLRGKMVVSRHDLLADPGLRGFDLVVCRDLGQIARPSRVDALFKLRNALRPAGALLLGRDKAPSPELSGFDAIDTNAGLYRKSGEAPAELAGGIYDQPGRYFASLSAAAAAADEARLEALGSSRAELQASREELYSLNRELFEVNARLTEVNAARAAKIKEMQTQRNMLAGGLVIALFLDCDLRIQWFTAAAAELFPISERDLGRALTDFMPRFDDPGFVAALQEAPSSGRASECEVHAANGRWYSRAIRLYERGPAAPAGLAVTFFDITAQKQTEDALRETGERLRLALSVGELATWDWNLLTNEVVWSDQHYRMQGYEVGEVAPSYEAWAARVHPDDRAETEAALWAARDAHVLYDNEFRTLQPDGAVRWLSAQGSFFYDDQGDPVRMIGVMRDVTVQNQAREALRQLNTDLEQQVQVEVQKRERAIAQLARTEKLAALGELAGGVAHDFNNILQAIATSAEVMRKHPENAETVSRATGLQIQATQRGASITRRMLAFARQADLHAEAIAAPELLANLREILGPALGVGIRIAVVSAPDLPRVHADRSQLETALINLATNARDAMPDGGDLVFSIARETVAAKRGALTPGDYLRIEVSDTGEGMDAATLARASEPFFTTKPVGQGTGLGLAMARGFAEQSGGALEFFSTRGAGTRVTFWLPVEQAQSPGAKPPPRTESATKSAQTTASRILLVDDEPIIAEMLSDYLSDQGLEVTTAVGGAEALGKLDLEFDVLVSDLSMPEVGGVELARAARARRPELPVLILTGYAGDTETLQVEHQLGGPIAFLRKPVTGDELLHAIKDMTCNP